MRRSRELLPALHRLLSAAALAAALAAGPAGAEGRHDTFAKCTFDDGRVIVLAEDGEATVWIEDDLPTPATNYETARKPSEPLVTIVTYRGGGAQRLDIYAPLGAPPMSPHPAPLAALLSQSRVEGEAISATTVSGSCAEFNG